MDKLAFIHNSSISVIEIENSLENDFELKSFSQNSDSFKAILEFAPELIILEISEDCEKSFKILNDLKTELKNSPIPFVVISPLKDISFKGKIYKEGAFDYIEMPFDGDELKLKIEGNLRKKGYFEKKSNETEPVIFKKGFFKIDFENGHIEVKDEADYSQLELTALEFKLLSYLIRNEGKPLARKDIVEFLGDGHVVVSDRAIDVHISSLRKKSSNVKKSIKTIYGFGYKFIKAA